MALRLRSCRTFRLQANAMAGAGHTLCYMSRMQDTTVERVRRRRDKLRAAGLRPVQIWVPDTRADGFAEECARQARCVHDSEDRAGQADLVAWFAASDTSGWTE